MKKGKIKTLLLKRSSVANLHAANVIKGGNTLSCELTICPVDTFVFSECSCDTRQTCEARCKP
ncbi:hypothetical protein [Ascidiimonas aurantiaca]|uniref:hypothetical protein n=1 Tax=Ascidiimonas aurantiaca TaxID=1685432 RepID=UPI0030EC1B47